MIPRLRPTHLSLAAVAALAASLVACGGGGGADAGTGTLRMAMTDAPACGYDHVYVTVEKVRVHASAAAAEGDAGWQEIVLPQPKRIDLNTLTNGVLAELGQTALPAGHYQQVRLVLAPNGGDQPLANAVQPTGGQVVALTTPSGQQSGLKLKANFDVAAGQMADLVLDFDACRSVVPRGNSGQYNLRPVVSVVPRLVTGVAGYVDTQLPLANTLVAVQQGGITVRATAPDATGHFSIPYLPAGDYNVVISSEGHSTAVVTGVPVSGDAITEINGSDSAIAPPDSTMADVSGSAQLASSSGPATALTEARVRALQSLSSGPTVELAQTGVDADGQWLLHLPVAAPVRSSYSAGKLGAFTADDAVAGKLVLQAQAPERQPLEQTVDLGAGTPPPVDFLFN